ncbi:hypothetical protein LTS10_003472 [Elasticomyces elasticus]|nr:hypothetical protein LTS10_003472 [Elasticomyces elasticus]
MASFPVIDFAPFSSPTSTSLERHAVALKLDEACRNSGFFYLKGHGVPQDMLDSVRSRAIDFFRTASDGEKQSLALKPGDNARGYVKHADPDKGSHEALDFYRPVEKSSESFAIGQGVNQWPSRPADFRSVAEAYTDQMEGLGKAVIEALALALGVDSKLFLSRVDKPFWQLRMVCYPGQTSVMPTKAGIGEHTDYGILTFLLTDATKQSLQVQGMDGKWVYADPIEGCFLCNIGDMLAEWTRGAYKSTAHRVVHTSNSPRVSIPFFFDPDWDAYIEPVLPPTDGILDDKHVGVRYRDKYTEAIEQPLGNTAALPA